ncbi:MAG: tetratricopeptide repeat protein, partial [Bdellovibrionales bacterium]|nr:tetratricopeptide repeat protein [Bdellovibrionales bacterium]
MKKFLFVFFILGTITLSASGSLENVTRDRLIEKFKKVYIGLAPGDSSRGPVALRLADLLSERARLQTMEELGKDCGECRAGEKDRLEALKFYKVGLSSVPERSKGKVFAQMGHLYELLGEAPKARALYQDVINKKMGGMAEAEAYISLAEMAFKSGDFASAVPFYSNAIEHPGLAKKGYAIYRRAWSYFNQGNYSAAVAALTAMLKDPKLLTRSGDSDHTENLQFKEEVSRDLATFMARQGVGLKDANLLYSLSPDRTRLENVSYLAAELERLGQLKASAELWIFVQQKESDPLKRFEGQMHLAQVYWNLKDLKQAQNAYVNALDLWKAINGCQGENCSSYKSHMRAYLLEWHRVEKKAPSEALVTLYEQYLEVFPEDTVLKVNLARIQQQLKQWTLSYALYIEVLKGYDKNSAETKKVIPDQEALLTTLIDVAESSKEENLQLKSYQTYLDLSQARLKEREVRYQLAYIKYKKEDYLSAEKEFYDIATNAGYKGAVPLKVQAADLVLDILALLKKDDIVGQRA